MAPVPSFDPSSTAMISNSLASLGRLGERLVNERLDVLGFVMGGKEERQAGYPLSCDRAQTIDSVDAVERAVRPAAAEADRREDVTQLEFGQVVGQADHVDRPLAQVAGDHFVGGAQVLVDHGPIIHHKHVRPLAVHELCIPERGRVAPPGDHHRVRLERGQRRVEPALGGRVGRLIDVRVAWRHGGERGHDKQDAGDDRGDHAANTRPTQPAGSSRATKSHAAPAPRPAHTADTASGTR